MSTTAESQCRNDDLEMCTYAPSSSKAFTGAVYLRNASTSYGFNPVQVFNNLNLTVEKGSVYALLGASGCGKTTLLNCILGCKKLNSGQVWALGGAPGSKSSAVPGRRVGYMPQETALYENFTIQETLSYFGWLAGMTTNEVTERREFLTSLLLLPQTNQFISELSGGQQRRVSFAAALIHSPELLILDEPTVGLDSTVRETVWNHLIQLAHECGSTVIITTHYIEEAKSADCVALMRNLSILVEDPPCELIQRFQAGSLEEIFFKLSGQQDSCEKELEIESGNVAKPLPEVPIDETSFEDQSWYHFDKNHLKVIMWRELIWLMRNFVHTVLMLFLVPIISFSIIIVGIGKNPRSLSIAMVNHETNNSYCNATMICNSSQLSCIYVNYLQQNGYNLVNYDSEDKAIKSVLLAENYASVVIPFNYTKALKSRLDRPLSIKEANVKFSEIVVVRDTSNKLIANFMKAAFYESFQTFMEDYAESCGAPKKALKFPIDLKPIYGDAKVEFLEYILPGFISGIIFLMMVTNATMSMSVERKEGGVIRGLALNVTIKEVLLSHIIVNSAFVLIQTITIVLLVFGIFSMTIKGSLFLAIFMIYLTGVCGMYFGFVLGGLFKSDAFAGSVATGIFLIILILGGVIWPLEAMHPWLQPFVNCVPLTSAVISLRNILQRGWGLNHKNVFMGFLTLNMWSAVFLIAALLLLKFQR